MAANDCAVRRLNVSGHHLTITPTAILDGESCDGHVDPLDLTAVIEDPGDRDVLAANAYAAGLEMANALAATPPEQNVTLLESLETAMVPGHLTYFSTPRRNLGRPDESSG